MSSDLNEFLTGCQQIKFIVGELVKNLSVSCSVFFKIALCLQPLLKVSEVQLWKPVRKGNVWPNGDTTLLRLCPFLILFAILNPTTTTTTAIAQIRRRSIGQTCFKHLCWDLEWKTFSFSCVKVQNWNIHASQIDRKISRSKSKIYFMTKS